jgi:hypothetical protein
MIHNAPYNTHPTHVKNHQFYENIRVTRGGITVFIKTNIIFIFSYDIGQVPNIINTWWVL